MLCICQSTVYLAVRCFIRSDDSNVSNELGTAPKDSLADEEKSNQGV